MPIDIWKVNKRNLINGGRKMLIYITGTENQKRIENAIYEIQMEHTLSIGEPIKSNNINLLQEVKSTLCKNKDITTLIKIIIIFIIFCF